MCLDGEILPELAKAWHTPGANGNAPGRGQGQGFVSNLMGVGYVPVPHDIETTAFGESRAGAPLSAYLDRHEGVSRGRPVVFHCDAWRRPVQLGNLVDWQRDHEGWKAFLRQCLALVSPDGLVDMQISLAVTPVLRRIRAAQDRDDARGQRMLSALLSNLPPEHVPDDLRDEVEPPKPTRKRVRKE
jgi:hypothetical protein